MASPYIRFPDSFVSYLHFYISDLQQSLTLYFYSIWYVLYSIFLHNLLIQSPTPYSLFPSNLYPHFDCLSARFIRDECVLSCHSFLYSFLQVFMSSGARVVTGVQTWLSPHSFFKPIVLILASETFLHLFKDSGVCTLLPFMVIRFLSVLL